VEEAQAYSAATGGAGFSFWRYYLSKRFYWLKLDCGFFNGKKETIIQAQENGDKYIKIWLKILLLAIQQDDPCRLRITERIPYSSNLLADTIHENIDHVEKAIKLFIELDMIKIDDEQTIWIDDMKSLVGSETQWAQYKRQERITADNRLLDNVQTKSKEIEKRERREEKKREYAPCVTLKPTEYEKLVAVYGEKHTKLALEKLSAYKLEKGRKYKSDYGAVLSWAMESVGGKQQRAQTCPECHRYLPEHNPDCSKWVDKCA